MKTNKVVKVFKFGHWQLVITQVKKIVCKPIGHDLVPPGPAPLQHDGSKCAHIEWVNGQKVCFPTLGGGT
ncbi:hypothetical protein [Streptomyces sp. NBC_01361]|uniref:hypothetical protein n=1 Tax=Streptomyces sp. NBC_01361 TaxID=2903838 RepID=UPI002E33CB5F|nr:hypothetical protein [Streptomyces sp. NBC_01361]